MSKIFIHQTSISVYKAFFICAPKITKTSIIQTMAINGWRFHSLPKPAFTTWRFLALPIHLFHSECQCSPREYLLLKSPISLIIYTSSQKWLSHLKDRIQCCYQHTLNCKRYLFASLRIWFDTWKSCLYIHSKICNNCDICKSIDWIHFGKELLFITFIVLHDAKRINPNILFSKTSDHFYDIINSWGRQLQNSMI